MLNRWYRDLATEAGVRRITSHGARHTAGSSYAVMGAGQKVIGALLGHSDSASTERNTHVAPSATAALVQARWLRLGGGEGGRRTWLLVRGCRARTRRAIHDSAIMSVRCPMSVANSRESFLFPIRRLGCCGVLCFLAVVLWGCSEPLRPGTPSTGGTLGSGDTGAGGLAGTGGMFTTPSSAGTGVSLGGNGAGGTGGSSATNSPADASAATGGSDARPATGGVGGTGAVFAQGGSLGAGGSGGTRASAGGTTGTLAGGSGGTSGVGGFVGAGGTAAQQGVFVATGSMTVARSGHTATLLQNGKVLIAGGGKEAGQGLYVGLANAELYDPGAGTFTATGNMTVGRYNHTATLLGNGQVLIAGGSGDTSAELYDPAAGAFAATGNMSTAMSGHTATPLENGEVLVVGGTPIMRGVGEVLLVAADAELYDPATWTFAATGSVSVTGWGHTASLLPSGGVLLTGGSISIFPMSTAESSASAEVSDPAAGTFTATGNMTTAREDHTSTLLGTGKVLVAGGVRGWGGGGELPEETFSFLASAEVYDPAAGTFTAMGSMTVARSNYTATLLPSGNVLIAGGESDIGTTLTSAELYDAAAGTFTATGSMTTKRYEHTATLLPSGKVLIAGGNSGATPSPPPLASAELYQ